MDFCDKSSGFANFKNTVDRGLAVNYGLMFGSEVLSEIWITDLSSALVGMLMSSSKLKLRCETAIRIVLCRTIKYAAFFTICAKLTMAFTFTSLLLNFYTSVPRCDCGFGFEQKHWWIDGFGGKKARIGGFA